MIALGNKEHTTDQKMGVSVLLMPLKYLLGTVSFNQEKPGKANITKFKLPLAPKEREIGINNVKTQVAITDIQRRTATEKPP